VHNTSITCSVSRCIIPRVADWLLTTHAQGHRDPSPRTVWCSVSDQANTFCNLGCMGSSTWRSGSRRRWSRMMEWWDQWGQYHLAVSASRIIQRSFQTCQLILIRLDYHVSTQYTPLPIQRSLRSGNTNTVLFSNIGMSESRWPVTRRCLANTNIISTSKTHIIDLTDPTVSSHRITWPSWRLHEHWFDRICQGGWGSPWTTWSNCKPEPHACCPDLTDTDI